MTGTDIRHALHEIADAMAAPAPDRLAFQREVRRERGRRTAGRSLVGAAAAACVGVAATVVGGALPEAAVVPAPPVAGSPSTGSASGDVGGVVFVVLDGRLTAWDGVTATPLGRAEGVLGSTQERGWALDPDSRIVARAVVDDPEGPLPAGFTAEETPYDEPVQSAALSMDGRYLAWVDLDEDVTVYDLAAGAVGWTVPARGGSSYVVDVSAAGVLVSDFRDELVLHRPDGTSSPLPLLAGWTGLESRTAGTSVLVTGPGEDSSLMRLEGSLIRELRTFDGSGVLSPSGELVVTVAEDGAEMRIWDPASGERLFDGLDGVAVTDARWVDDGSEAGVVLAVGETDAGTVLYACSPVDLACGPLPVGEGEVRIDR